MSADSWDECPRCMKQLEEAVEKAHQDYDLAVVNLYGKVDVTEYERLKGNAKKRWDDAVEALAALHKTFREDYEFFGANEGVVRYNYSGSCSKCGLSTSFEGSHPIPEVV